jgi:CheY-like chemotaxis protein
MKGEQERGLKAGFEAYFTKPIDIAGLMAVLTRLFEEKKGV